MIFRFLGGIHFAIALIATTLLFVIAGTFLEAWSDSHLYAARFTYGNPIFSTLLWLFFVNILFAALTRYPFQKSHIPFLLTHLGLLMILGGALIKSHFGLQGTMGITEGSGSHRLFLPHTYALALESRDKTELIPLKKGKLSSGSVEITLLEWTAHSEERLSPEPENELLVFDKGFGGYGVPTKEGVVPLARLCEQREPHRKQEELRPRILLLVSDGKDQELVPLTYDPFASRLKWPILQGRYLIRFQAQERTLPHHVRLRAARTLTYPGTTKPYSFESDLLVNNKDVTLSMNRVHQAGDGTRFYLANILSTPWMAKRAQIAVNQDPAKYWLTYPGGVILTIGIGLLYRARRRV